MGRIVQVVQVVQAVQHRLYLTFAEFRTVPRTVVDVASDASIVLAGARYEDPALSEYVGAGTVSAFVDPTVGGAFACVFDRAGEYICDARNEGKWMRFREGI